MAMQSCKYLVFFLLFAIFASGILAEDFSQSIIYDITIEQLERKTGKKITSQLSAEDKAAMMQYRFDADTLKVLAIPVEWSNRPGTYSRETLDSLIFSRDVYPDGSVADYYYETSYGQMTVVGDVIDWYDAGYYDGSGWFDFTDILPDIDPIVDYSQYDGNGDGYVDAVIFIRSGTGEEDSQDPSDIWSYAMSYNPDWAPGPFDGVLVTRYNTSPELLPLRWEFDPTVFSGETTLNKIRVFCHELGHNIGLPDLYDYDAKLDTNTYFTPNDDNDHPLYDWCVMGYYGYGYFSLGSEIPTHFCGWSKKDLGWIEPIELIGEYNDLVVYNIETTNDSSLYMIPINPVEEEYFLLEYRNPNSTALFDKLDSDFSCYFFPDLAFGNDPLDRGLLITHVHEIQDGSGSFNNGTPGYPHYRVAVEDAGYNPALDMYSNPEGHVTDSAQWWYPYETRKGALFSDDVAGQDIFSPTTFPSSDGHDGLSGITIRVDSIVDDKLFLYVITPEGDSDFDGIDDAIDNCPGLFNPDQSDDDQDSVGNVCDNCPDSANTDQADADGDGVGDKCDICPGYNDYDDGDSDGVPDGCDLCIGFDDDLDVDYDDVPDSCDNCPVVYNPNQIDSDTDGIGDLCDYVCGDANGDSQVNVADAVFLINYVFKAGSAPYPLAAGNDNCDGDVNVADAVYIISYVFKGGPEPCCP
jgi:M6 family metalloprotease-like protein